MNPSKQKSIIMGLGIAVVVLALAGAYFYWQYTQLKQDPQVAAQKEVASLVARVSQLIVLPTDETPTVATVTEPEKLKDQAFFANAQEGDKVLIYTTAKKAILYSPSTNKIVDVAPLSIGQSSSRAVSTPTPVDDSNE